MNEQETVWYCMYCGTPNPKEARYCGGCGKKKTQGSRGRWVIILTAAFVILCVVCLGILKTLQGKKSVPGIPSNAAYLDVVQVYMFGEGQPATFVLCADGTLRIKDFEALQSGLSNHVFSTSPRWSNLKQVDCFYAEEGIPILIGLKKDGSVVCDPPWYVRVHENEYNPETLTNIDHIVPTSGGMLFVTRDHRVLPSAYCFYGEDLRELSMWRDIQEVFTFPSNSDMGIFGVRTNGSTASLGYFYAIIESPQSKSVRSIANSNLYGDRKIFCLYRDGTVSQLKYGDSEDLSGQLAELTDIEQITAVKSGVLSRTNSGNIIYSANDNNYREVESWRNIIDIQSDRYFVCGLCRDGSVKIAADADIDYSKSGGDVFSQFDSAQEVRQYLKSLQVEVASWKNIVNIKVRDGYVLGWQKDGTLLTAGIDLSWLN